MRPRVILRRIRRLGIASIFNSFLVPARNFGTPDKHFKIDDDEDPLTGSTLNPFQQRQRSTLFRVLKMILLLCMGALFILGLTAYIIYKPPPFVINYLQRNYPDVLFQVEIPTSQRVVALTLDDAPSPVTERMLDILKAYHAKATFFAIGNQIAGREGILKRIHEDGHEIGNHAWADEPSVKLPLSELEKQIKHVEGLIPANSNGNKYFRPGSGFFNSKLVQKVSGLGYRVVLGGIYPHDPQIHNPSVNANHVLSMVRPGGIIIMHDRRSYSVEQLELVLKGLAKNGWRVVSVGGLLKVAEDYKNTNTS